MNKRFSRFSIVIGSLLLTQSIWAADVTIPEAKNLTPHPSRTASTEQFVSSNGLYSDNEIIVKFKKNISLNNINGMMSAQGLTVRKNFSGHTGQIYVLIKSTAHSSQELIPMFNNHADVESVSLNYIRHLDTVTPNDTHFPLLWAHNNTGQLVNGDNGIADADMDSPEAWVTSQGSSSTIIASIDTGVDYLHEDLASNMWVNPGEIPNNNIDDDANGYIDDMFGINSNDDSGDPMDDMGHGTHTVGTAAATGNNGLGVTGVSWNTKIMALKYFDLNGTTTIFNKFKCMEYVLDQKMKGQNIISVNASYGGYGFSQPAFDLIEELGNQGILFIASAGNDANDTDATPHYPSSYALDNIISVASTDQDDGLSSFSNFGALSVDLAAPGRNILSTLPRAEGTSNLFFDDMENDTTNWILGGDWNISIDQEIFENSSYPVPSPTHFLSDSPGGYYSNGGWTYAVKRTLMDLSLHQGKDVILSFGTAIDLEGDWNDIAYLKITGDGGENWTTLQEWGESPNIFYWKNYTFVIPEEFKTDRFAFGFYLSTNETVGDDGWLIDDVSIDVDNGESESPYGYKGGTSMAAPQVTGAVALLASKYPNESPTQWKQRIMDGVDPIPGLDGLMVTGGRLNIHNAITQGDTPANGINPAIIMYLLN